MFPSGSIAKIRNALLSPLNGRECIISDLQVAHRCLIDAFNLNAEEKMASRSVGLPKQCENIAMYVWMGRFCLWTSQHGCDSFFKETGVFLMCMICT